MSQAARTALTLTVLALVVVLAAALGWQMLTRPLPTVETNQPTGPCTEETVAKGTPIRPGMVTVSVYNAGTRSGLADETLGKLAEAGFGTGETGNAEDGTKVRKSQVWVTSKPDPSATLVASYLGTKTMIVKKPELSGPGVNVIVGNDFREELLKGKRRVKAPKSATICRPNPEPVE